MDINIDEIIRRTLAKYRLSLYKSERDGLISFFDSKKKIIEGTLHLIRKEN